MGKLRIAIFSLLYPDKFDVSAFSELFVAELDSAFTADLACCDSCYDDFVKVWPGLAVNLQQESYPLDLFYERSAFPELYTVDEFFDLCRKMGCPVCDRPLEHNLWPYNTDFDVPFGFEADIKELTAVATRTPFLTLRHPLARRVLREILKVGKNAPLSELNGEYFRARPIGTLREGDQFFPPPAAICGEGRYNHAGLPVLYVASKPEVAHAEVGHPDDGCLIARLEFNGGQKILDLADDLLPSDILQAVTASSLISAPAHKEGWEKPEYTFSRFVADCAVNAGFTAIRYPSVARDGGFNLVMLGSSKRWSDTMNVKEIFEFHSHR